MNIKEINWLCNRLMMSSGRYSLFFVCCETIEEYHKLLMSVKSRGVELSSLVTPSDLVYPLDLWIKDQDVSHENPLFVFGLSELLTSNNAESHIYNINAGRDQFRVNEKSGQKDRPIVFCVDDATLTKLEKNAIDFYCSSLGYFYPFVDDECDEYDDELGY